LNVEFEISKKIKSQELKIRGTEMLCQKCQQRQATVFFSQTVGNQTTQAHLCESCAQEQSQAQGMAPPFVFNPFAALSDFLNNFMAWNEGAITEVNSGRAGSVAVNPQLQCPYCGYQLSTFQQNGRLGCTKCYESFRTALEPLISSIHGNVRHIEEGEKVEKVKGEKDIENNAPSGQGETAKPDVAELRKRIEAAIKAEKYEEAARLRDVIKKMEKG
jgi:protein arginine kinase activator